MAAMIARRCLLATLALISAACGKSDAESFADEYCAEVKKCCDRMGSEGDGMLCKMMFTSGGFNAEVGEACLADMRKQVAAGTFCTGGASASACQGLVSGPSGNRKPGESCDFDDDCAPSSEGQVACASDYDGTEWIHQCQLRIRGAAGSSPCLGTQDGNMFSSMGASTSGLPSRGYVCDTADGLECSADQCVALAAVGQSCNQSSDCVRNGFCDDSYHCAARVAPGGPCTSASGDECTVGHYCPTASPRQCTAKVATGSPCSDDAMCTSSECNGTTCEPSVLEQIGWGMLCM
jgi:hypothetical protein